jgi:hypothetical protein
MGKKQKKQKNLQQGLSPQKGVQKTQYVTPRRELTPEETAEAQRARERKTRKELRENPQLRFTPYAWAKLRWCCHHTENECGGFGITPTTPDLVEDFVMVKQDVTPVTVEFEDTAVADFTEDMVDRGLQPHQFLRVWLHTHPNMNPSPGSVAEETFERVFGKFDFAIMFILSTERSWYCRVQTNVGIPMEREIGVSVDYSTSFGESDTEAWEKEYDDNVVTHTRAMTHGCGQWDDDGAGLE